uniref:PAT complex subunit Asterix n=1 Tax=Bubo bubo TaxID=30461 RepID=A0A8C0FMF0_BUBBB
HHWGSQGDRDSSPGGSGGQGPPPECSGGTGTITGGVRGTGSIPGVVQGDRGHLKWCAWIAVYCSFISFANSRSSEDTKQMMSSFMLSISAVVMSYLQNPQPMSPPW